MKKSIYIFLITFVIASCKSEFESVRTSNNPEAIFKKALEYYEKEDWLKAQTLLELSIPNYRGKTEAEDLFFKYAYAHYYNKEYILAAHYFKSFATTFYNSERREEAEFMSAYSNYQLSPNYKLDQSNTLKAIDGFQLFVNAYPRSERVQECNDLMDNLRQKLEVKAFDQGKLYYNIGQYEAAVKSFWNMLNEYPDTKFAEEARYLMIKSKYEFAVKSIFEKKKERFEEAMTLYNEFRKKHKSSKYASELEDIKKNISKELTNFKV